MAKIAVCYFSYFKDLDFLNMSLEILERTINKHKDEHEIKVYVLDDGNCEKHLKKKELYGNPTFITTHFNRKGNLNGYDCIKGMFQEYKNIQKNFDYDYIIKLDSDCTINSFDYIKATENYLKSKNIPLEMLAQFGTYFAVMCIHGCCQTFGRSGIECIHNLIQHMERGSTEQSRIMKKRVELGYNEDKVVSVLLEMSHLVKVNVNELPNIRGNLNAFQCEIDTNFEEYTSVDFKPYTFTFLGAEKFSREDGINCMRKYLNNLKGIFDNKTVIPKLVAGSRFGNWLFTIAATYAHCLRNGYTMKYKKGNPLLDFVLNNKFVEPTKDDAFTRPHYKEPTYHYTEIPSNQVGYIHGFFQSSKYFSDYKNEIINLFKRLKSEKVNNGVAAIHVRMGDYLQLSQRYKSPTKNYIEKAIRELSPEIKRLIVFSDEPKKAVELVKNCKGSERFVISSSWDMGKKNEIEDMFFMTACEELIMSCSSFSWWAAYLGEHKKVIVDKKWYNDNELIDTDIYEDSWIKI